MIGQQLGNYKLIRLIGRGGFAEVYLGRHVHLKTEAAVKVLLARLDTGDEERFRHEAEIIARLVHPHIVRVLDFAVQNGIPFLVMEYASGGNLRKLYPKGMKLPLRATVKYTGHVASALQYAHDQHVIHRDVKPENMLVTRDYNILLSDFGLALQSTHSSSARELAGTLAYMAPEQIQGQPEAASDQYALGVVVYEWLTGLRPFEGTAAEITAKHLSTPPPPLRARDPAISVDVEQVVLKALSKEPAGRFVSVDAFADALTRAAQPGALSMRGATTELAKGAPETRVLSRHRSRDLTSIETFLQQALPQQEGSSESQGSGQGRFPILSRRALLFGGITAALAGSTGLALAAWRHPITATLPQGQTLAASPAPSHPSPTPKPTPRPGVKASVPPANSQPAVPPPPAGTTLLTYRGHTGSVSALAFSPDGARIASASYDGTMQVWDARSGTRLLTYRTMLSPSFRAVAWSPNGTRIATGSVGHLDDLGTPVAQVWDATAATLLLTYRGQNADISDLAFSPDSSRVASASQDGTVQVWDARTGNALLIYRGHSGSGVNALAWSPDGSRIVSGGGIVQGGTGSGAALLWDARSGATLYTHAFRFTVNAVAFSPDGSRIASDDGNQSIIIWSAGGSLGPAGTTLLTYTGHASSDAGKPVANGIESIAWSPDGSRIASADGYGTVRIWDARSGTTMLVYRGHSAAVFAAAWSPDGSRIASASEDTTVQVWQA